VEEVVSKENGEKVAMEQNEAKLGNKKLHIEWLILFVFFCCFFIVVVF